MLIGTLHPKIWGKACGGLCSLFSKINSFPNWASLFFVYLFRRQPRVQPLSTTRTEYLQHLHDIQVSLADNTHSLICTHKSTTMSSEKLQVAVAGLGRMGERHAFHHHLCVCQQLIIKLINTCNSNLRLASRPSFCYPHTSRGADCCQLSGASRVGRRQERIRRRANILRLR